MMGPNSKHNVMISHNDILLASLSGYIIVSTFDHTHCISLYNLWSIYNIISTLIQTFAGYLSKK